MVVFEERDLSKHSNLGSWPRGVVHIANTPLDYASLFWFFCGWEGPLGTRADSLLAILPVCFLVCLASSPQESERSIVKGGVPIGHGDYSLRQITVILKREPSNALNRAEEAALTPQMDESKVKEGRDGTVPHIADEAPVDGVEMAELTEAQTAAENRVAEREAKEAEEASKKTRSKLPEIILFWARSMRRGGDLVVCPNEQSMNRLIRAYLVCEIVQDSQLFDKSM